MCLKVWEARLIADFLFNQTKTSAVYIFNSQKRRNRIKNYKSFADMWLKVWEARLIVDFLFNQTKTSAWIL